MKKIFLSLSLLLFVSCVNIDKLNVFNKNDSKVAEKSTANTNKNVASSKKDKQKKSAPIVPTKGTKSKNLLKDAEVMPEDNYASRVKKYKAYNSLIAFNKHAAPAVIVSLCLPVIILPFGNSMATTSVFDSFALLNAFSTTGRS